MAKRNHTAYVAAMARLTGNQVSHEGLEHHESEVPAQPVRHDGQVPAAPWQPTELAGFRVGDCVKLPNIAAPLRVVGLADPLLILESPSGHQLRAGWRACTKIPTRAEIGGGQANGK